MPYLPILAFAAPLGADSAAVCTAMGASERIVWRRRLVIAGTLTSFEALTPALGMVLSGPVGAMMGDWATYVAAALLVTLGVWVLAHGASEDEAPSLTGWRTLLALGVAVSLDEIAVGISLGLAGVPMLPLVATVAVWVFAATMTGLVFGARLGARFQRHAGTFAAVTLILLGVALAAGIL